TQSFVRLCGGTWWAWPWVSPVFPGRARSCAREPGSFQIPSFGRSRVCTASLRAAVRPGHGRGSFVGAPEAPLRIAELALDQRVELEREQPQPRIPARMLLVEPALEEDHRDGRDVTAPVALLRLALQRLVA